MEGTNVDHKDRRTRTKHLYFSIRSCCTGPCTLLQLDRIFLFPFPSSFLSLFPSPFHVSSSLRHRYVLCDPIVPSCPTAAQVRDTTRHARTIAARIARHYGQ